MPEGDTIHRTARTLHATFAGRTLTGLTSPLVALEAAAARAGVVGRGIVGVEARGKHLLMHLAGGFVLHTHLGMHGSWHVRRADSPRALGRGARLRLTAGDAVALCFGAPVVELLSESQVATHPSLVRLGPDLLAETFDAAAARARLLALADEELGVALLDQQALAGLGNVYKSELLFLCGLNPRRLVRDVDERALDALLATARELLRRNLGPGRRRTTPTPFASGLWVYERGGRPCRRCGTAIVRSLQGDVAQARPTRSTYACPRCQA